MNVERPRLVITMGDPSGIGPEVIIGCWDNPLICQRLRPVVIGHPDVLRRAVRLLGRGLEVITVDQLRPDYFTIANSRTVLCLRAGDDDAVDAPAGRVDARSGEAAYQAVRLATQLALQHQFDALVTAPLSKAALHAAGHPYPGHTELLAEMCGVEEFAMMLYLPAGGAIRSPAGLGVVHVTLHQALRTVFDCLTPAAIVAKCHLVNELMRRLGASKPRLAVCALNPHAGEDGLFGDEESGIIAPAVEEARATGLDVSGPHPTDTLMLRARDGEFDAVVAMYHDQGHIAFKLLGMHAAVNITLGLPIVRTSVAHGTAFDRAWQGTARSDGMVAALTTAARLAAWATK